MRITYRGRSWETLGGCCPSHTAGVEAIARAERERVIDRAMVDGYRRMPPAPIEETAALESLRQAIAEERW
jgi:hypothetical protein